MCLSKPSMPAATSVAAAPALQPATTPGAPTIRRRPLAGLSGGTLLTSPSGISTAASTTGANTLLGA